jgi:hypothetical protein
LQSEGSLASSSESEFEADSEELAEIESSDEASAYDGSDASEESGSDFGGDDESDEGQLSFSIAFLGVLMFILLGDDWDELERKAAKCEIYRFAVSHPLTRFFLQPI